MQEPSHQGEVRYWRCKLACRLSAFGKNKRKSNGALAPTSLHRTPAMTPTPTIRDNRQLGILLSLTHNRFCLFLDTFSQTSTSTSTFSIARTSHEHDYDSRRRSRLKTTRWRTFDAIVQTCSAGSHSRPTRRQHITTMYEMPPRKGRFSLQPRLLRCTPSARADSTTPF